MVDHHVDRPEVEGGQPLQLTGTNRSMHWSAAPSGKDQVPGVRDQEPGRGGRRLPEDTHTTRFGQAGDAGSRSILHLIPDT